MTETGSSTGPATAVPTNGAHIQPLLESRITCPECGHQAVEQMPINACQYFYDCSGCGVVLKPKAGDCCVFCSYGTVACPPIQTGGGCCR